jgi:hypothetical protein
MLHGRVLIPTQWRGVDLERARTLKSGSALRMIHGRVLIPTRWSREWRILVGREWTDEWSVWGEARWSFVRGEDCWVYDQSPTLARNREDHGYIRMDKYLHWYEALFFLWGLLGIAQEQIHEGLGPKWTISYQCGDRWCP